ncbi:MAG TPA: hypothetical protein VF690_02345, partial [Hymenobacter sp.]
MRFTFLLPAAFALLLTSSCSEAQTDQSSPPDKVKGGDRRKDKNAAAEIPGLREVGSIKGLV